MRNEFLLAGVSERVVNVMDMASILDFGAYNRVHRHLMGNYIFYWAAFGIGLLTTYTAIGFQKFGHFKWFFFALPFLTAYWIWTVKWVIPRFWKKIIQFLTERYGSFVGDSWGMIVKTLDIEELISIAQQFDCFTYERIMLLASFFDDRSNKSKMFIPLSPGVTALASAIFGTLFGGLLLELVKVTTLPQFDIIMVFFSALTIIVAGYVFFCNDASRRHARTAELLREAALLAPR